MSNYHWKPMPDHPGYEINRSGWVRNERGYVVASGRGAQLMVGGARFGVTRKRLLEIAAGLFGKAAPPLQAETVVLPVHTAPELAAGLLQIPDQEPVSVEERVRCWNNPERVLPLRDPWADGSIETHSDWDWAGVR